MDAQMTKGVVELCILHMISKEKRYGYEIMKHINQVFPHMKESTIYAVLKRLYKEGNAQITMGETSGGPPRKYYFLTQQGKDTLATAKTDWFAMCKAVAALEIVDD